MGGERGQRGRRGAVQSEVCVTAEGGTTSHQQGGGCEVWRAVHTSIGVRGFIGMETVLREDGGAVGGGSVEGREGMVLGWEVTTARL